MTKQKRRRVIERAHLIDLLHAIYNAEGWKRSEGESMVSRCKELYDITMDASRNRFIATPRNDDAPQEQPR